MTAAKLKELEARATEGEVTLTDAWLFAAFKEKS